MATTTLAGTLADQPCTDYTPGQGINAVTGALAEIAVEIFTMNAAAHSHTTQTYVFVTNENDYQTLFSNKIAAAYNIQYAYLQGFAAFLQSVVYSDTSLTLVAILEVASDGYGTVPKYALTATAQARLEKDRQAGASGSTSFRDAYGDYFVGSCQTGSRFVATYICSAADQSSLQSFKTDMQAKMDTLSASGVANLQVTAQRHNVDVECSVYMDGISKPPQNNSNNASQIPVNLTFFLNNLMPMPLRAKLIHYSQLDNSISTQVPIDPQAFADVQALNVLISELNSSLSTLPAYYPATAYQDGQTFADAFHNLQNTFDANRGTLPSDAGQTRSLTDRARAMRSALDRPLAAYAFYKGLQVLASNAGELGQSGSDSRRMGVSAGTAAVEIKSIFSNIAENAEVGTRTGSFDWPFSGVSPQQIVTGWYIHNVWDSDANGSWQVDAPLIGRSGGSLSVRGKYDRGIDWTLYVYYCDRADFPWL